MIGHPARVPAATTSQQGQRSGDPQRAVDEPWLRRAARFGMVCRGLVYAIAGALTVWLGIARLSGAHDFDRSASEGGAVHTLADAPAGRALVVVLAVGFAGFAVFQVIDTVFHARKEDSTAARVGHRIVAGWGIVLYAVACAYTLSIAFGPHPGRDNPGKSHSQYAEITARVMGTGAVGRLAVLVVGGILIGSGVGLLRRAVTQNFRDRLDRAHMAGYEWRLAMVLGSIGCVARAVAIGLVGGFVVAADVSFDASESSGLDGTLRAVAANPVGAGFLVPLGLGLACYCGYVWFEARYRKV